MAFLAAFAPGSGGAGAEWTPCTKPRLGDQALPDDGNAPSPHRARLAILELETAAVVAMAQLHVRKVSEQVVARLKQQAARSGRSMEAEHRLILEEALFPERRPGRRLLEVLQAGPLCRARFRARAGP